MLLVSAVLFAVTLPAFGSSTRQLYGRGSSDDCAFFSDTLVQVKYGNGASLGIGLFDVCLCVSGISDFIATSPSAALAVELAGLAKTTSTFAEYITSASTHKKCQYPDQAIPACSSLDVCYFTCQNGFTAFPPSLPTGCVCEAPNKICNGVCAAACPSPNPKKRHVELQDRHNLCDTGLTACGVYGFDSTNAWECIDTKSDLESCGGCTVPLGRSLASGIDCTALPGVMDVACLSGSCAVQRCQPGLAVAPDGASCTPANPSFVEGDVLAAAYGLEHVPLKCGDGHC